MANQQNWALLTCTCQGRFAPALTEPSAPFAHVLSMADPEQDVAAVAERLAQHLAATGCRHVLTACCAGAEPLASALAARGVDAQVHALDIVAQCYGPHGSGGPEGGGPEGGAAVQGKALRLLRGAAWAAEHEPEVRENFRAVGGRLVLATDHPDAPALVRRLGEALAAALGEEGRLTVFWEGTPAALPHGGGMTVGQVQTVAGHLGAFTVAVESAPGGTLERGQGGASDGDGSQGRGGSRRFTVEADQVVLLRTLRPHGVQARTGLHLLGPEVLGAAGGLREAALQAAAGAVGSLTGEFMQPEHLTYNAGLCAGGAAGKETCGRCIAHCPYGAIARDGANSLRIAVQHLSCEGCGACTAACPTGALAFTDPAPAALLARLAGLLCGSNADSSTIGSSTIGSSTIGSSTIGSSTIGSSTIGSSTTGSSPSGGHVVAYHCSEQGARALEHGAQLAGRYPATVLPVEVPCLRHLSATLLLAPLGMGAAGVALLGCAACPHGARPLLLEQIDVTERMLDALGLGAGRLRLITADEGARHAALDELTAFANGLEPTGIPFAGGRTLPSGTREALADTLGVLLARLSERPNPAGAASVSGVDATHGSPTRGLPLSPEHPFALPVVDGEGCTLCRACTTLCPTQALKFDPVENALSLRSIACVGCGLCEEFCPEQVITLRRELDLHPAALSYQEVARDEPVHCPRCDTVHITKRALEKVEAVVLNLGALPGGSDGSGGAQRALLRLCPQCRSAAAQWEVRQGWQP